jgi:hypothetical protein
MLIDRAGSTEEGVGAAATRCVRGIPHPETDDCGRWRSHRGVALRSLRFSRYIPIGRSVCTENLGSPRQVAVEISPNGLVGHLDRSYA